MAARSNRTPTVLDTAKQGVGDGGIETIKRLHELFNRGGIQRATLRFYSVYRSQVLSDRGAQFIVYTGAGVNTFNKGDVVVKCVKFRVGAEAAPLEDDRRERATALYREVQVLTDSRLRAHPNIVTLLWYDFVDLGNKTYIPALIMERATLGSLDSFLYTSPMSIDEPGAQMKICAGIISGLLALHNAGVVHGDVKCENILMFRSEDGVSAPVPKIADFGSIIIMKEVQQKGPCRYMGTPWTNAPEVTQTATFDAIGLVKCDNYSLGLVISNVAFGQLDDAMTGKTPSVLKHSLEVLQSAQTLSEEDKNLVSSALQRLLPFNSHSRCGDLSIISSIFHASAQGQVGDVSLSGLSISASTSKASSHLRTTEDVAVALGSTFGNPQYLDIELDIELVSEKDTQALLFDSLTKESKSPDSKVSGKALFQLSLACACGFGTPYNEVAALSYATSSARTGYLPAQATAVAFYTALGRQAEVDLETQTDWLFEATAWGSFIAARCLRQLDRAEYRTARAEFHKAGGYNQFFYSQVAPPYIGSSEFANTLTVSEMPQGKEELAFSAAIYGDVELLRRLILLHGATEIVDLTTDWGESLIVLACKAGHLDILGELVTAGAKVSCSNEHKESPIHWLIAFEEEGVDEAAALLKQAWTHSDRGGNPGGGSLSDVQLPDMSWNHPSIDLPGCFPAGSPLHFASFADSAKHTAAIVRYFPGEILPINWKGSSELTPVEYALPHRKLQTCQVLINCGALDDTAQNCEILLGLGQRLRYENWVSSAMAMENPSIGIPGGSLRQSDMEYLLVNHCLDLVLPVRPEVLDFPSIDGGFTPLMSAVEYHDRATVKALLSRKCNVNARTSSEYDDRTALNLITENKTQYPPDDIIYLLREAGADFAHQTNQGGKRLIHFAARDDCLSIARILLAEMEEDPDTPTAYYGLTPLHIAAEYGSLSVATLLMDHGASTEVGHTTGSFNRFDWDQLTPLALATLRQRTEMIKLLLEKGKACGIARPPSGHTVVHLAVTESNTMILQTLLAIISGLKISLTLNSPALGGITPLHLCAALLGRDEHLRLLLDAGAGPNLLTDSGHSVLDIASSTLEKLKSWRKEFWSFAMECQFALDAQSGIIDKESIEVGSLASFLGSENSTSLWKPLLGERGATLLLSTRSEDWPGSAGENDDYIKIPWRVIPRAEQFSSPVLSEEESETVSEDERGDNTEESGDGLTQSDQGAQAEKADDEIEEDDPTFINVDDQVRLLEQSIRLLTSRGAVQGSVKEGVELPVEFLRLEWRL